MPCHVFPFQRYMLILLRSWCSKKVNNFRR